MKKTEAKNLLSAYLSMFTMGAIMMERGTFAADFMYLELSQVKFKERYLETRFILL